MPFGCVMERIDHYCAFGGLLRLALQDLMGKPDLARREQEMVREKKLRSTLFAAAMLLPSFLEAAEQQGIISKVPDASGATCYLRFPAIREETLYWPPVLVRPRSAGTSRDYSSKRRVSTSTAPTPCW